MLIHSAVITGSVQLNNTDVSNITNVAGFATTASVDSLVVKTGSYASTSSVNELQSKTGSYATTSSVNDLQSVTGSYTTTSSFGAYTSSNDSTNTTQNTRLSTIESVTGSFATTGSNQFNGNQSISGSIVSNGTITAQTLVVQTVTSSIEFVTGSTRNGSLSSNTHEFTGSILMTGSLTVTTTGTELQVNAGGVNIGNALTDNHIISGSVTINSNGLFVSSSRNVGIGTVTPLYNTHIVASGSNVYLGISNQGTANGDRTLRIGFGGNGANTYAELQGTRLNVADDVNIIMQAGGGNVGIGTTTPSTKLEVSDATNAIIKVNATSADAQAVLSLNGYASGGVYRASRVNFQQAGTNKWAIIQDYNQNNTNSLTFEQAGSAKITFDANGRVGIGNASPSTPLHVTGTISSNDLLLAGTLDYSYSTSDSWTSYQNVIPNGALVAQAVYLIRFIYSTDNGPWVVCTSFTFSPANTNGGGADGQFAPMISTHQGGTGIIYVRAKAAYGSVAGLDAYFSGFTKNTGNLSVKVIRLM